MEEDILFDETKTIEYILNGLDNNEKKLVNKELVQDILDYIFDFYDEMGFLEGEDDDEVAISEEELFSYVKTKLIENKVTISDELLEKIMDLEYKFSEENGVF